MYSSLLTLLIAVPTIFAAPFLDLNDIINQIDVAGVIPDKWIVNLGDEKVKEQAGVQIAQAKGIFKTREYSLPGFRGFAFDGSLKDVTQLLKQLSNVKSIEPDKVISLDALVTQSNAPWGLARVSNRHTGSSSYFYDGSAGAGTYSYIVDSGINTGHVDFGGRASMGANFIDGEGSQDGNGHGTHVAGIVGGTRYGVAKKTTLIGVKVFGASGTSSTSAILAGVDWAVGDARNKGRTGRSVINMSLGGSYSRAINDAAKAATDAGIFMAVAAGNNGEDASNYSPASAPSVCTVGATDINDNRAKYSNFGKPLDIYAPGSNILSTWIGSSTAINTISGTSMASPHIAGLAAYVIAVEGTRSPTALCSRLQQISQRNAIKDANKGGSPNLLAYNGNGNGNGKRDETGSGNGDEIDPNDPRKKPFFTWASIRAFFKTLKFWEWFTHKDQFNI